MSSILAVVLDPGSNPGGGIFLQMDGLVKEEQTKSLSKSEVEYITEGKCKVVLYADLVGFSTLEEAAAPYDACICLFESRPLYGHWVCWFKVDEEKWEWFDSYGVRPDGELKWLSKEAKEQTQQSDFITQLVKNSSANTRMIYNQVPLQKFAKDINTCGRWCAVRIRKRELPLKAFQELFYKNGDYFITLMTLIFDGEIKDD